MTILLVTSHLLLALSALFFLAVHPVSSQIPSINIPQGPANNAEQAVAPVEPAPAEAAAPEEEEIIPVVGNVNRMIFFTLRFGLKPGSDALPLQEEVVELLCATQEFLLEHIGDYISNEQLSLPADIRAIPTNIGYKHEANGLDPNDTLYIPLTVEISFTIEATYLDDDGALVPEPIMIHGLEMTDDEMLQYIYYVHDHTGFGSIFQDVMRVHYDAVDEYPRDLERTILISKIDTCSDEQTIWELPAPTVPPQEVEDMVYFQFGVAYPDDPEGNGDGGIGDGSVPTEDEIHQLMCALNRFIQQELAESTGDDSITAQATNIQWIGSSTKEEAGITLYFTADATDGQGQPIPKETVSSALQDVDQEGLLQFLKTEGVEHFLEEGEINPMLELPTSADLEPLPEGTPVREGNMEVSDCPSVDNDSPSDPAPNRGSGFDLGNLVPGNEPTDGDNEDDGNDDGDGNGDGNGDGSGGDGSGGDGNGSDGDGEASVMTIEVDFLVSNMDGITDPNQVQYEEGGLASSWPTLVNQVVNDISKSAAAQPQLRGRRRKLLSSSQPNLGLVQYRTNSSSITKVIPTTCGNNAPEELKCHTVHAKYDLLLPKEINSARRYLQLVVDSGDASIPSEDHENPEIRRVYEVETYKAIYDGTYYDILLEDTPDSPMFIGTLPERAVQGREDYYDWLWLVILLACLLALLLCCLLCWCLYYYCYRKEHDEEHQPPPRVVQQHTHVWVKNEDTTTHQWDDEEDDVASQTSRGLPVVEDHDPYALALVPVETEGQLVPLDSRSSHHTADPLRSQRQGSASSRSLVSID